MRRPWLIAAVSVVAVVAMAVAYAVWPRGATARTEAEALADFRADADDSDAADPVEPDDGSSLPAPGVYIYATEGSETAKIGVLPADTRDYPDETNIVITSSGAACFNAALNLLDQHTEDTTYCVGGDRVEIDGHTKHQSVGALNPTASMTCDDNVLYDPAVDEQSLACVLELSAGPADIDADVIGTATWSTATVTVDGDDIDAIAIDVAYVVSGGIDGTWNERLWLSADSLLPLRVERDLDLEGLATFSEHSELVLLDTEGRQ